MANLPEIDEFTAGIYQLEVTDPNEAGPDGVLNYQGKATGNRTLWLKNRLAEAQTALATETTNRINADNALGSAVALINKFLPKNRGFFYDLDVSSATSPRSLPVGGDVVSAVAVTGDAESTILVTVANTMGNNNYFVKMSIESESTAGIQIDNDIYREVFRKATATTFYISIREPLGNPLQKLKFHIEVISLD